ncbi:nicotianamine synthase-like [Amaranthus tricolor]|uniref:nicotianamine synthase-like n=1 Tax=Amaranthus tricolor TaxID=29722 RepID=UPI00258B80E8|nr:nicotianamine synthase-like [Amaranthus tricolor]
MVCQEEPLVNKINELYEKISSLESLKPSQDVNMLFTQLVHTCMPPNPIDVTKLCNQIQEMRSNLIRLCGEAEGLLEKHYSTILASFDNPLHHLDIFPYFSNYLKLSLLEYNILTQNSIHVPKRVAFVGSGPLPLTSIVLALNHLHETQFDNYDIDPSANEMAARLVEPDPDLSSRMKFHTKDVMSVGKEELEEYDVVFLAALVGMNKEEKIKVIHHLAKNMAPGSTLMVRSAHGARAFLYPVVDPENLCGFEVLSVFHPTDEVINSVVIARKAVDLSSSIYSIEWEQNHTHNFSPMRLQSCKCLEIQPFNPLNHGNMIGELASSGHQ